MVKQIIYCVMHLHIHDTQYKPTYQDTAIQHHSQFYGTTYKSFVKYVEEFVKCGLSHINTHSGSPKSFPG